MPAAVGAKPSELYGENLKKTKSDLNKFMAMCRQQGGEPLVNSCELTASITALANALACRLTNDELNLLGIVLTQPGDILTTIATQRSICGGK